MTTEAVPRVILSQKENNDEELRDPNVGFWEKWNNHVTHKQKTGIIRHASFSNRWMPRIFFFTVFGGTGWMVGGSIPHYHRDSPGWMLVMEAFTTYVFIQVFLNYFLIKNTGSRYDPDTSEKPASNTESDDVIDHTSDFQQQPTSNNEDESTNKTTTAPATTTKMAGSDSSTSYRILVATSVSGSAIERKSFPYWSWMPCVVCQQPRPPRCHHCTICQQCVLKRDHHCYFTRVCVGVNNHRFYIYFLLWSVVLTWLACVQLLPYLFGVVLVERSYWNLLMPINVYTALVGTLPLLHLYFILVVWAVIFCACVSTSMLCNGVFLLLKGLTSFEHGHRIKILDTRNYAGRMQSVLGRNWAIHCFIPANLAQKLESYLPDHLKPSEPLEDALHWPYIKTS